MHDELDLQITHLLQIDPRMPWVAAARILGVSASSLARRWTRLSEQGLAWISTYPTPDGPGITAFIEVQCKTGRAHDIATQLCRHRTVLSLDECSGDRDLLLTVIVPSQADLATLVLDVLPAVPGVTRTRCSLVTAMHAEGSSWRVDALDPGQKRAAVAQAPRPTAEGSGVAPDGRLLSALARDGRASVAALARELGRPSSTIHRELGLLRSQRQVISRCDVAPNSPAGRSNGPGSPIHPWARRPVSSKRCGVGPNCGCAPRSPGPPTSCSAYARGSLLILPSSSAC